jgi:hypothetical protein
MVAAPGSATSAPTPTRAPWASSPIAALLDLTVDAVKGHLTRGRRAHRATDETSRVKFVSTT